MRTNITTRESRTANSRFAKAGVSCFYDSEVLNSSFEHLMKFSAKNPRLRKAANRCRALETEMKNYLLIFLIPIFFWSCNSDNFYETERYFITDRDSYQIGDEFELTVIIAPKKKEKEIRFYDNYKNLGISFALINSEKGIHNGSWTKNSTKFLDITSTTKFKITKEEPFKKTFIGKISETKTEVIIEDRKSVV